MDELLEQFIVEAVELVQHAADDLLALEREPASPGHIESLFRSVHTLKGSVGLFDFPPLQQTLFAAEDVLTLANRAGELDVAAIDPLIGIIEWTERCIAAIAATGALPDAAPSEGAALVAALAPKTVEVEPSAASQPTPDWAAALFAAEPEGRVAIRYVPRPDSFFSGDDPVALMATVPMLLAADIGTVAPWPKAQELDPFQSNLVFEAVSAAPRAQIEALFRLIPDQVALVGRPSATAPVVTPIARRIEQDRRTIRVDVERVDALVDVVGELFVAKNALTGLVAEARRLDGGLPLSRVIATAQEDLDRLSTRLHRAATGVRMVALGETFRRLPRLVREVSAQLGKPVDIEIEGGAIEADKAIVDALFEPLLHVLRNAIDHGIETADIRAVREKPARGRIRVVARQVGYRVEVTVADDGAGVDIERVRASAVAKGVVSAEAAAALDDAGVRDLLFQSGFSTAAQVNDISGRGVGMDAVRRDIQKLGGRVALDSEAGAGTRVTLSLPVSFAVTRIMIVEVAGDRYALPLEIIQETLRVDASAIHPVRAGEAVVLRERTVPVVRLGQLLGLGDIRRNDELLLVTQAAGATVGLIVDALGDRLETVLRPPAGLLKTVAGISGTTVLGDGNVVMVLDLEALIA